MSSLELNLYLHPKQSEAFLTPATEVLYGGAAGGGKSHLMRAAAISWCVAIGGLQIYLFRRTFPDLMKNHMEGPTGFPALLAAWVKDRHAKIVYGNAPYIEFKANGSKIHLNHCQHEKDVYKYQGSEIHALLIDELTQWTESMYRFLRGRCRMSGIQLPPEHAGLFPRILCGANPGGIGHNWVKASFVDIGNLRRTCAERYDNRKTYCRRSNRDDNPCVAGIDRGLDREPHSRCFYGGGDICCASADSGFG